MGKETQRNIKTQQTDMKPLSCSVKYRYRHLTQINVLYHRIYLIEAIFIAEVFLLKYLCWLGGFHSKTAHTSFMETLLQIFMSKVI